MRRIGIFGGTFDPIHNGHLRIALECREALSLDQIKLIPCAQPSHRDAPEVSGEQRLAMLSLAIDNVDCFSVDDRELNRDGPSYTVDTLVSLKADYSKTIFYLIIGSDSFQYFNEWHQWEEILSLSHLVIARRPGYKDDLSSSIGKQLKDRFCSCDEVRGCEAGKLVNVDVTQLDISASQIRENVKNDISNQFLLPNKVIQYIQKENLYK